MRHYLVWTALLAAICFTNTTELPADELSDLGVSENGRFLVRKDGSGFFPLPDTAWAIAWRLNRGEVEKYLQHRKDQKFNTIALVAFPSDEGGKCGLYANVYGDNPFEVNSGKWNPLRPIVTPGGSPWQISPYNPANNINYTAAEGDAPVSRSPRVDCDFPGGNIIVDAIDGDTIRLHQDLRDTRGDWFYWYFRVRGAAGRTLRFEFLRGNVIGVLGPSVSLDQGNSWTWLGTSAVNDTSFRYAFPPDADEVRFSFAMPYVESNLRKFLNAYDGHPNLKVGTLCETRKGRKIELLHIGRLDRQCDHRVLVTCRHHACEMMANYTLEGMMEAVLADTEDGNWFREHVEFLMIPFVDKDGVEDGDQGKNRKPHDHGLDYAGQSIYPSVLAIKKLVPEWSEGRLRFSLDLHCPWICGAKHEILLFPHLYRLRATGQVERAAAFLKTLEAVQTGLLVFKADDSLLFTGWGATPYEKSAWIGPPQQAPPRSISLWVKDLPGVHFANGLEIPYANVCGKPVTAATARTFGQDLARATRRYLAKYGQAGQ